jgi:hypothetical protein
MTGAVGATDKTNPSVMDRMYDTEPGFWQGVVDDSAVIVKNAEGIPYKKV